jgi:hypothetical protein
MFVGILGFFNLFCSKQLTQIQKKDFKNEHPIKRLALLVLTELQ